MWLTIALSATATYSLALIYFSPDATIRFGQMAGFVCLASMFAGVALVWGPLSFRRPVPFKATVAAGLTLFFAASVSSSSLAAVPAQAFIGLPLLPIVLFGAVVLVRMLIQVW